MKYIKIYEEFESYGDLSDITENLKIDIQELLDVDCDLDICNSVSNEEKCPLIILDFLPHQEDYEERDLNSEYESYEPKIKRLLETYKKAYLNDKWEYYLLTFEHDNVFQLKVVLIDLKWFYELMDGTKIIKSKESSHRITVLKFYNDSKLICMLTSGNIMEINVSLSIWRKIENSSDYNLEKESYLVDIIFELMNNYLGKRLGLPYRNYSIELNTF